MTFITIFFLSFIHLYSETQSNITMMFCFIYYLIYMLRELCILIFYTANENSNCYEFKQFILSSRNYRKPVQIYNVLQYKLQGTPKNKIKIQSRNLCNVEVIVKVRTIKNKQ